MAAGDSCAGRSIIAAYPFISNYLYERRQQDIITSYETQQKTDTETNEELENVKEYNKSLAAANVTVTDPF